MAYDNTNSGLLLNNERKEKDSQPDFKGSINIEGRDYWLSGWWKTGQRGKLDGVEFISLSAEEKEGGGSRNSRGSDRDRDRGSRDGGRDNRSSGRGYGSGRGRAEGSGRDSGRDDGRNRDRDNDRGRGDRGRDEGMDDDIPF